MRLSSSNISHGEMEAYMYARSRVCFVALPSVVRVSACPQLHTASMPPHAAAATYTYYSSTSATACSMPV